MEYGTQKCTQLHININVTYANAISSQWGKKDNSKLLQQLDHYLWENGTYTSFFTLKGITDGARVQISKYNALLGKNMNVLESESG